MAEKHYAFLRNDRVESILVFAQADGDLAQRICVEQNFDGFVWLDDTPAPILYSTYDSKKGFTDPTEDYLITNGIKVTEISLKKEE